MLSPFRLTCLLVLLILATTAPASASGDGQADLDRATEVILTAATVNDLDEVIELCRSALEKGVDQDNAEYARSLLASTLIRRGVQRAGVVVKRVGDPAKWPQLRTSALADLEEGVKLSPKQPEALFFITELNLLPGGDAQRAREAIDQAVEASGDDPIQQAKILMLRATIVKDNQKRLADLEEAIRLAPHEVAAVRARALVLADLEKYDEALAELDKAIAMAPDQMATYEAKTLVLLRLGKQDEALAVLEQASREAPESTFPMLQRARIFAQRNDLKSAVAELDRAQKLKPDNVPLLLLRAEVRQKMGQRDEALADLERVVKLSADNPAVLAAIAKLNLIPGGDQKRAAEVLDRIIELYAEMPKLQAEAIVLRATLEKDANDRLTRFGEALRIDPKCAAAYRGRGLVHAAQGRFEQALADFDQAIQLDPTHLPVYEAKAMVYLRTNRLDAALATFDEAARNNPGVAQPLVQKSAIYSEQGNHEAALEELNRAVAAEPNDSAALLARAATHEQLEQPEKALEDVDTVLKLQPEFNPAMRMKASLLAELDRIPEGIVLLEKLHGDDPEDVLTAMQLGLFYNAEKQFAKAAKIFSVVLKQDPNNESALRGRGDALLNDGRHKEAIADYDEALKLQPQDVGVLNNLAWVLSTSPVDELRNGTRAVALASQACQLTNFRMPHILSTLAAAYAETGDFQAAIDWTEKGIALANDEEKAALTKELEHYRNKRPMRELLSAGEPVDPKE